VYTNLDYMEGLQLTHKHRENSGFSFIGKSIRFLADRTNGRAIATLLRLSSSSVTLCIVA